MLLSAPAVDFSESIENLRVLFNYQDLKFPLPANGQHIKVSFFSRRHLCLPVEF